MRLTRRGWATVAFAVVCLFLAWDAGARSLNAVVAPLLVALLAGVVAVVRAGEPTVSRSPVEPAHVGDVRTVELAFDVDSPTPATVDDAVGDGLAARGNVATTTLTGDGYRYELECLERGDRAVGPVTVTVTDVLGLVQRRVADDGRTRVLVYPRVYELRAEASAELRGLVDAAYGYDRDEFDHLRAYERGDSLRDVHWKSAAKRPDAELMVREFADRDDAGRIDVVAESTPGRTDEMATAAASVATSLLAAGISVRLVVPDGDRRVTAGQNGRRSLLELLATTGPGEQPPRVRRDADVLIRADDRGTAVRIDGRTTPFDRLRVDASAVDRSARTRAGRTASGVVT